MIADIITLYRQRGLRGAQLNAALRKHAAILQGCDPGDAAELLYRCGKRPNIARECRLPKRMRAQQTTELDPIRAAWYEHDRRLGLTRGP